MELNQLKKPYAPEVMKEYCRENIDKYDVDTMVCEAFQQGLIREVTAFIHLRVAQMKSGKVKITKSKIAEEVGFTRGAIANYIKNSKLGITDKVYIQYLIKKFHKEMLDLWERSDFNQALAGYVNRYRSIVFKVRDDEGYREEEYELDMEKEITKDVCRKIYKELVNERIKTEDNLASYYSISVEMYHSKKKMQAEIKWEHKNDNDDYCKIICIEVDKERIVHELVLKMQKIIAGMNKSDDICVFLVRSKNRKVSLAMEYIAITNEKVYLR